jgi:ABC-type multidrug transport system ATPase subunit
MDIEDGESLALLGSNGAGKSTTILMLATIIPTEGTACIGDYDIRKQLEKARGMLGIAFQRT